MDRDEELSTSQGCRQCGGEVNPDGWCEVCGARAPKARDWFTESWGWVGGVCDRGLKHERNEDAMALWASLPDAAPEGGASTSRADPPDDGDRRAVLVVCDGVSTSRDSHLASMAAARATREVLVAAAYDHLDSDEALIHRAMFEANRAVLESTGGQSPDGSDLTDDRASSCTIALATVHDDLVAVANLGDSRVFWIADAAPSADSGAGDGALEPTASAQLSVDDSMAQLQIDLGVDRETAEHGPQAHAITRWLGADAPDLEPQLRTFTVSGPGWLMVCSDGLWNYASTVAELQALLHRAQAGAISEQPVDPGPTDDPVELSRRLMLWACEQGGRDNITVALARLG